MKAPEQLAFAADPSQSERRLIARNMAYLAAAQVLTIPLSAILNALYARYLGAAEFGLFYVAGTLCGFGIIVAEWGQQGTLPALVVRDRSKVAEVLGTGLAWRTAAACVVYIFLAVLSLVLGYSTLFQWVLAACFLQAVLSSLVGGYKDSIRGFERADIPAAAHIAQQGLLFLSTVIVLMLGGRLVALLIVAVLVPLVILVALSRVSKRVGIGTLKVRRENLAILFHMGGPFVLTDIAMALQPTVDAMFLSRLALDETVGWYAISRRLIGVLILPATSLTGSLYPTLCRLWMENRRGFAETLRDSLNGVALLAVPAALGCILYPGIGVAVFGGKEFGPAESNLRVMSVFLFLVYFSMPIGTAVLAIGKRRAWSIIQSVCIVVSVLLDPLLITWFQRRIGNGGIGLCVAAAISESLVVIGGIVLLPRGVLDRSVTRTVVLAALSGVPMAAVAFVLRDRITPFLAAPLAVSAYFAAALISGAITKSQREAVVGMLRRRLLRLLKR